MAEFNHKGLTLRWTNAVHQVPGQAQRVLIEGGPVSPANMLTVLYSIDGLPDRMTRGWPVGEDPETGMQAFAADLPAVPKGKTLNWRPVLTQGARHADPGPEAMLTESMIPLPDTSIPKVAAAREDTSKPFFPFHCEYLFRIFAPFERKSFNMGVTPDGIPMRFRVSKGGVVRGPAMNADILEAGGDWMRVREDGIGMIEVHALMRPESGGMLLNTYTGIADFGPDSFKSLAAGDWPDLVPVRMVPRYLTSDPKWAWMNRIQCVAIGEVNIPENMIQYDEYVVRSTEGGRI
ncbi:MAG: DUF3237 domain-containing protein [Boseongicola sp.]